MRQGLSRLLAPETMAGNLGRDSLPLAVSGAWILGIASQLLLFATGLGYGLMAASKLTAFLVQMFMPQRPFYYEQFVYVHIDKIKPDKFDGPCYCPERGNQRATRHDALLQFKQIGG
jgi:hypothetical protein